MRRGETWSVQPVGFEAPVEEGAKQLADYLGRLAPVEARALPAVGAVSPGNEARIVVGTSVSLADAGLGVLPKPSELDDALAIIPKRGRLFLVGSNARSALYAAYRLLEELGVVFLRPGPGGEVIPRSRTLALPARVIREKASYRHRGICIEGSPRLEHVLGVLDWMAKKKMNTFQLQFRHAGVFWRRGYNQSSEVDALARRQGLSDADCIALDDRVIARCKELGMVVHRVGHGWTAATLGYDGVDWNEPPSHALPQELRPWVAEVGGRRDFHRNEPSNTELCYSNPEAREAFLRNVLDYAKQHPEVDALHVWLSDAVNNKCECAGCRKFSPTDWYMQIVNELGRRFKQEGIRSRLVFLGYFELIWPPEKVRLAADNAIFMYAPMGRCYWHALDDAKCGESHDLRRPALNDFQHLGGNKTASALARLWRAADPADTFLFDYHGWAAMWRDGLGMDLGETMAKDMKAMEGLGLNGLVSCQCIRAFYPHPYMASAMADKMWDRRTNASSHRRKIMSAAFGKHASEVEDYLSRLVNMVRVGPTHRHGTVFGEPVKHREELGEIAEIADMARRRFGVLAERERDEVVRLSLELMSLHAEQTGRIAGAYLAGLASDRRLVARMRAEYGKRLPEVLDQFSLWVDPKLAEPVWEALAAAEKLAR
jgi:hypothetical protein